MKKQTSQTGDDSELDPYVVACQISNKKVPHIEGKTLWIQDSGRSRRVSRWRLLNPNEIPVKPLSNHVCRVLRKEFGITHISQLTEGLIEALKEKLQELGYDDYQEIWEMVAETKDSLTNWIKVCKLGKGKRLDVNQLAGAVQRALHKRHQQITEKTGATISTEAFISDLDMRDSDLASLSESGDGESY